MRTHIYPYILFIHIHISNYMGSIQSTKKVSFEDIIDTVYQNKAGCLLVNTLPITEQDCLLSHTILAHAEESAINNILTNNRNIPVILYGKNTSDNSVLVKYEQLSKLGLHQVYVYPGGLFEWLLLQEIYGDDVFPTTSKTKDIYRYRPPKALQLHLIK